MEKETERLKHLFEDFYKVQERTRGTVVEAEKVRKMADLVEEMARVVGRMDERISALEQKR
jgi:hypothetical protein